MSKFEYDEEDAKGLIVTRAKKPKKKKTSSFSNTPYKLANEPKAARKSK